MPAPTPSIRELTRRLIGGETQPNGAPESAAVAAHAACERTYRELTRILGVTGAEALLLRSVAQAQTQHPLLAEIRIGRVGTPDVDGVAAMVTAHGAPAVAAALESVLEGLLELLARLIGPDMVAQLVEQSTPMETQAGT